MIKRILSISGRPGLYNLVSQGKNCLIVESLTADKKRLPVFNHDRVMSLGDIAIYTTAEEVSLAEVFEKIKVKHEGKEIDIKALEKADGLRTEFKEILPDFDEERVRTSDIKKVFTWYNLLVQNGITEFVAEEEETAPQNAEEAEKKEE